MTELERREVEREIGGGVRAATTLFAFKETSESVREEMWIANPTLPDDHHFPIISSERFDVCSIALGISVAFGGPVPAVASGFDPSMSANMFVPKAAFARR